MEILAPAGTPEGLVACIKGGCDAVYLAGKTFGARAFAGNFTDKQLQGAMDLAHDNGVKVYVTVNTSIKDSEMNDAVGYVKFLADIGADAVLIQDLGLLKNISRVDIVKHASTQMGIHNLSGVEWCSRHGIDRVVLARELTFEEISDIVKGSPIETEVFVQGALCYCMSGGCLFSSMIGGRSGNRGQCAQPCRKKYTFGDREGFLLSNADLYGVDWLKKLNEIGVTSAKIEGRMRSVAYAYLATKTYALANKGDFGKEYEDTVSLLKTVFNRGICDGYLSRVESPVQWKYADNRGYFLGKVNIVNRSLRLSDLKHPVHVKDGISIFSGDEKIGGFKLTTIDKITSPFPIKDGLYDIYRTYDPEIDVIKNLVGDAPELTGDLERSPIMMGKPRVERAPRRPELSFYVNSLKTLDSVLPYADRVYFDMSQHSATAKKMCNKHGVEFVTNIPRFHPSGQRPEGPVMIHSAGQVPYSKDERVYGSYSLNTYNNYTDIGLYQTTLSCELSKSEIDALAHHTEDRLELMVFGRTELMVTRDPSLDNGKLTDEKGYSFPVYKDETGLTHILNSSDLLLLPYMREISRMGIDSVGIDVRKRPSSLAATVAKAFAENDVSMKGKIMEMCGGINYGCYLKGVE